MASSNTEPSAVTDTDIEKSSSPPTLPDPDVVDWEGPEDPTNPLNWPKSKKTVVVALVSILTLLRYTTFSPILVSGTNTIPV